MLYSSGITTRARTPMNLSYHPDQQRHNPLRAPGWRWRRAHSLVARGRYFSHHRDDEATGRAVHYLRALARCPQGIPSARVVKRYPEVCEAHRLYEDGGTTRLLIEARLLARQPTAEIARLTGVAGGVIDAYEALHFNIADRLDARDWVLTQAVGRRRSAEGAAPDRGVVLKSFAYFGGPLALEAVLPYLAGGKDCLGVNPDLTTPEGRREQAVRLAVAAQLLPDDVATGTRLFKIMLLLLEGGRKRPESSTPAALLVDKLESRLAELPVGASEVHTGEVELPPAAAGAADGRQTA
jgi:hypothetical protein